jgi:hypothetical protein
LVVSEEVKEGLVYLTHRLFYFKFKADLVLNSVFLAILIRER